MDFYPGMGQAVAERTILRKKGKRWEKWSEVAERVTTGNCTIAGSARDKVNEYKILKKCITNGHVLMSGRHLQHGDVSQPDRNMEVFTNCSTSITTFGLVTLLLNGSGVGRCYDDDLMLTNWDNAPNVLCVLDPTHKDYDYLAHESVREARHKYGDNCIWHDVEDSREGWGKAVELVELLAYERIHADKLLILNFSNVRPKGSPIGGMQDRPSSGPVPLMNAFMRVNSLKGAGMDPWLQAMYIDHYFAECVLVGGVRRSARMAVKHWKDKTIFKFMQVKRPIEFIGKTGIEVESLRLTTQHRGFLWSANNSVALDKEFWELLNLKRGCKAWKSDIAKHARKVFDTLTECAYYDGTGEPGTVNADRLHTNDDGIDDITGNYFSSDKYTIFDGTHLYLDRLLRVAKGKSYRYIVNPCGEIVLAIWGAFCTICDVCFYHCDSEQECEEAIRAAVRAMMRVNLQDSVYSKEVKRTNRIGIGLTGVHEFALKFFGFTFRDLIDEQKSIKFWEFLSFMRLCAHDEAVKYATKLGVAVPHTICTVKPSGTISKLFGLTEGWHLPSMRWYLRWVQFDKNNPLVEGYRKSGYPIKELSTYKNTVVVGFPTVPLIAKLDPNCVTAAEATPEEQYKWLMLGEKYWLGENGNQISYTLKYDPEKVSYLNFKEMFLKYQSKIRACSVMPQEKGNSGYEYLPEEPIGQAEYNAIAEQITQMAEDIGREHLDCGTGGCPVDFKTTVIG